MDSIQRTYEKARKEAGLDSAVSRTEGYSFPSDVPGCKEAFLEARTHPAVDEWRKSNWTYERSKHLAHD